MNDIPSDGSDAVSPAVAGTIARWLGIVLILGALAAFLIGVPGSGFMIVAGGILLIVGLAFSLADRRAAPDGAAAPTSSVLLPVLSLLMALVAFLIGAAQTWTSSPSSQQAFLVEGICLAAALGLFVLAIFGFGVPRLRLPGFYLSLATVGGLFLVSLALS